MEALHFTRIKTGRQLKSMSANELRAKLVEAGIEFHPHATRKELEDLIESDVIPSNKK